MDVALFADTVAELVRLELPSAIIHCAICGDDIKFLVYGYADKVFVEMPIEDVRLIQANPYYIASTIVETIGNYSKQTGGNNAKEYSRTFGFISGMLLRMRSAIRSHTGNEGRN